MFNINKTFLKYVPILSPYLVEGSFKIDKDLQSKRIFYTARAALTTFVASILTLTLTSCTGLGIGLLGASALIRLSIPFDKWLTVKESYRRALKEFIDSKHPSDELGKYICNDIYAIRQIIKQKGHFNKPVGDSEAGLITYTNSTILFKLIVDSNFDFKRKNSLTQMSILPEILSLTKSEECIRHFLKKMNQVKIKASDFTKEEQVAIWIASDNLKKELLKDFGFSFTFNDNGFDKKINVYELCKNKFASVFNKMNKIDRDHLKVYRNKDFESFNWKELITKDSILNEIMKPESIAFSNDFQYPIFLFRSLAILLNKNSNKYTCNFSNSLNYINLDLKSNKWDTLEMIENNDYFFWNSKIKLDRYKTNYSNGNSRYDSESFHAIDRRLGKIFRVFLKGDSLFEGYIKTNLKVLTDYTFKVVNENISYTSYTFEMKGTSYTNDPKTCYNVCQEFLKFVHEIDEAEDQTKEGLSKTCLIKDLQNIVLDYVGYAHGPVIRELHPQLI